MPSNRVFLPSSELPELDAEVVHLFVVRSEIDQIKQQIIQFENNLGFFANSKGANALKDQVEANIAEEQKKIEVLKAKLKMIPNE